MLAMFYLMLLFNTSSFLQFVTEFAVLYPTRDELVKRNADLEKQNAELKGKSVELEASLKTANDARRSFDLALTEANRAKEAVIKELNEFRQSYDLVCTSKLLW